MTYVERSFTGRSWCWRPVDEAMALAISQRLGLPELIGRVLAGRGIGVDEAEGFLQPRLRDLLPDPSHLLDLDRAVARLADAVEHGECVGIIGDYDVDGATSSALLARYLQGLGVAVHIDIPDRLSEGYGPNARAIERLVALDCTLLVILDSGTTAFDVLDPAAGGGLDIIVVDHHQAESRLPAVLALINPNRQDQQSPLTDLAAVGVVFVLLVALNRELRHRDYVSTGTEPDLRGWLDLVALGTICDVVPLTGVNRALVHQGLKIAARGANAGLAALARCAGVEGPPTAYQFGFVHGPRINAGGRIGQSDLGVRLLSLDDADAVAGLAGELHELNRQRRDLEAGHLEAAERRAEVQARTGAPVLVVQGEGWHPGVIGIVASRLVDRHHRPAVVIALNDGIGKGSGRSIKGFDLGAAVIAARQAGLLQDGGGHSMAAGLSIAPENIDGFARLLSDSCLKALGPDGPRPRPIKLDGALSVGGVTPKLARQLEQLAPYGPGNPEPRFCLGDARPLQVRPVGGAHLRCFLAGASGGRVQAIAFRSVGTPLAAAISNPGAVLRLVGRIKRDTWRGRDGVSFQIEDAAPAVS